jgi:hypothetical protein
MVLQLEACGQNAVTTFKYCNKNIMSLLSESVQTVLQGQSVVAETLVITSTDPGPFLGAL